LTCLFEFDIEAVSSDVASAVSFLFKSQMMVLPILHIAISFFGLK